MWAIRHAESTAAVRNLIAGNGDFGLSTDGILQACDIAKTIERLETERPLTTIYSSCLPRSIQTAEIIAHELDLSVVSLLDFNERDFGFLTGMRTSVLRTIFKDVDFNSLGGCVETTEDFMSRISRAMISLSTLTEESLEGIVITHGSVIKMMRAIQLNIPHETYYKTPTLDNGEFFFFMAPAS